MELNIQLHLVRDQGGARADKAVSRQVRLYHEER
jgi:hypothetical protein